ncbi:hypothetical protein ACFORL_02940 [Legionella dresdenensis]|uniref:Virulence protein n=1 Tax=Legionella dresdenensis TaxID=450200 RepID=A0ABV8CCJ2_9GAMM
MSEIVIYTAKDGHVELDVSLANETVWLTIAQMVHLFGRDKSVISRHLKNIFQINELDKEAVVAKFATTASDGKTYQVDYYNLDAIMVWSPWRCWLLKVIRIKKIFLFV